MRHNFSYRQNEIMRRIINVGKVFIFIALIIYIPYYTILYLGSLLLPISTLTIILFPILAYIRSGNTEDAFIVLLLTVLAWPIFIIIGVLAAPALQSFYDLLIDSIYKSGWFTVIRG